ncbi:glycosyltransferase family 4 protein [Dyella sp. LX-66]|uniref:glycosyltransferase family 4 protein n=1 Tax=unclassified Dyella TaxID=2634549 RepID=UPI001BE085CF|nr:MULTISPECIES: glycosyltransferase family 4 protein [unclassified Dyella]MBT2118818.1 glycosyltransferase family 4 protein [Dyella sp. LX-1]MBT2141167.1 glycosyltransferase family 4 protein [Dyella sp. LX-66]
MAERPRFLLVTRNLPPLVGGMERLNWHMAEELARYGEVRVIGPAGSAAQAPAGVEIVEVPLRPLWKFLASACFAACRLARRWRPDVVIAGSGLTALPVWLAARSAGARAATYVHGLDMAVSHPVYRGLWFPALRRMERIIANSEATRALAISAGVAASRIRIVHPGVQMPALPDTDATKRFRAEHDLGDRPLLLSVGRLSTRKGMREFVQHALPRIVQSVPEATLLVIGDAPNDALHARAQTIDSIKAEAARAGVAERLRFLGQITDYRQLGVIYGAADVHVFPVRELPGDPEGFGMVAVEAAAHGLPTVAFATGGVIDAVAEGRSGHLVEAGDYGALADAVVAALKSHAEFAQPCRDFAQGFAWDAFGDGVAQALSIDIVDPHRASASSSRG